MNKPLKKRSLSSLAPLLLFALFTACILIVLLSGADIYRKIAKRDQTSIQNRTVSQYLTTRLHQSDAEDMVFVGDFETPVFDAGKDTAAADGGLTGDTLYLREELNGRIYYTRIYAYDGMLRELFAADGLTFHPTDGTVILPVQNLHFTLEDQLLQIDITYDEGDTQTLYLVLRSGKEGES